MLAILKWLLVFPVAMYLLIVAMVFVFQRNLMYMPGQSVASQSDVNVPEMISVTVETDDGLAIECWVAKAAPGKPTIVLFQGNAGALDDRAFKARIFMDDGYGVILAGYRGFGGNDGKPTEQGLYKDARAVLSLFDNQSAETGSEAIDVIFYGESLGGGVAVHLAHEIAQKRVTAAHFQLRGVILEAPFTSMADAAAFHYPWLPARSLVKDRFDSIDKIQSIHTSLLIIHGRKDRTVPFEQGQKLFVKASEPKTAAWLDDAGHVDVFDFGAGEHILSWLKSLE